MAYNITERNGKNMAEEKANETRVAIIGIIVENGNAVQPMNELLHAYGDSIIGRMGIPHRERGISIISIAIESSAETINALTGKLGRIDGISAKATFSKV